MAGMPVFVLFVLMTAGLVSSQSPSPATYRVTFSSRIRPGMPLRVSVHLFSHRASSRVFVFLRNAISKQVLSAAQPELVRGGRFARVINLMVPSDLSSQGREMNSSTYEVQVNAFGRVGFDRSALVHLDRKSFSIFIQTDKPKYKPGQTVMMRILAMNADLSVLNTPMDVLVKDPQGNIMRLWQQVDGTNSSGVLQLSMPTSDHPPLGNWTIQVSLLGSNETKSFLIEKYVLPNFEAILRVPKKVLTSGGIRGTVSAKYTFGKPLTQGTANVTVRMLNMRMASTSGQLNSNGEFQFSFTKDQLVDLGRQSFFGSALDFRQANVVAVVKDILTGHLMETAATVTFEQYEATVEFLPITSNIFKPGLPYTIYLKATKHDDTLFLASESINLSISVEPGYDTDYTDRVLSIPANGYLFINETSTVDDEMIQITATIRNFSSSMSLEKAYSPSGNFLKVAMNILRPHQVGEVVQFTAFTTQNVNYVYYQVYAKGIMIIESSVRNRRARKQFLISFRVIDDMAPSSHLLVFYIRPDGEVVADSMAFKVEGFSDNPINITYSTNKVKAGDNVSLIVSARPDSSVFLLAVDKGVQLQKGQNDITQEQVLKELVAYDYKIEYGNLFKYMEMSSWPASSSAIDAVSTFSDMGVGIMTDATLSEEQDPIISTTERTTAQRRTQRRTQRTTQATTQATTQRMTTWRIVAYKRLSESVESIASSYDSLEHNFSFLLNSVDMPIIDLEIEDVQEVEKIRSIFPERWLWDLIVIGSSGVFEKQVTAPDTITTWLTTAFSVHPEYGLSVTPQATELTTFRDLFVSLDLPYSAIRGEDICLRTFAFNYYNRSLQMQVTLGQANGLNNFLLQPAPGNLGHLLATRSSISVTQDLGLVNSNSIKEADFCFTPTQIGNLPIRINLTSSVPGDGVEHVLKVEPEGLPEVKTVTVLLDAQPNVPFTRTVPLNFSSTAVQGSQVITVKVSGDLLVPVIKNLENLLRLPSGCGEQNMIHFAPDVFLVNYLQRTNTYSPDLESRARHFMLTGYQKEITYQRRDGSFSVWGQSDQYGSMWLTAFVTKCFVQAGALRNSVTIDPTVIKSSIRWMIRGQNRNGAFPEPGYVYHKEMQGGSAQGEALTAFVLVSLAEASDKFNDLNVTEQQQLQLSLVSARSYLEGRLRQLVDPYDISLVTYALHLADSSVKDLSYQRLRQKAIINDYKVFWKRNSETRALNIEMTSYALLTHVLRGNIAGAIPILRWLMELHGADGGFISTQDTVVGLQALAEMAIANHNPITKPIAVAVRWRSGRQSFLKNVVINNANKLVLQVVDVTIVNDDIPNEVNISALINETLTGFPQAKVVMEYNVNQSTTSQTYQMTYQILMSSDRAFTLIVEARCVHCSQAEMTVLEVGIPTGFSVDVSDQNYSVVDSNKQEDHYRKHTLYYNQINSRGIRAVLPMSLSQGVPIKTQPVPIKIYSYFEPGVKRLTLYYQLLDKRVFFCDNVAQYGACSPNSSLNF